jgi:receptor protein-tyrosine kinase
MNNIERLFEGERSVPGMRSGGSRPAVAPSVAGVGASAASVPAVEPRIDGVIPEPQPGARVPEPAEAPYGLNPGLSAGRNPDLSIIEPTRLKPGPELVYHRDPASPRGERMRLLRTELLLHHSHNADANAIAVLGPCAGEGRSLLAAELALSFAQFNRPTLLVDVDFRRPRQHKLFCGQGESGLAQAIAAERPPVYERVEGYANLAVVTAGARPESPLELLMDWRFESLLQEWRRDFEFIVLDTPPVSEFADALAVATVVGRVLLVYRAQNTPQKEAREMLRRLAATDAEIVGGALNHF